MPTDYLKKLRNLTDNTVPICKRAVAEGAGVVADQIRANASNVLSGQGTGEMMASFGVAPIGIDDRGVINTKVGFGDYDSKGKANAVKANALESGRIKREKGEVRKHKKRTAAEWARAVESGSSIQPKRPFIRPAVNSTRNQVKKTMENVVDEELKKIMD